MERRQSAPFALLVFALAMIVACSVAAFVVARIAIHNAETRESPVSHRWLHDRLELTTEQERELNAMEAVYQEDRALLQKDFEAAKQHLAQILSSTDAYDERVTHAVHEIHRVHGALQELAIRHYYDMLSHLPEDKQARLREMAVQALSEPQ